MRVSSNRKSQVFKRAVCGGALRGGFLAALWRVGLRTRRAEVGGRGLLRDALERFLQHVVVTDSMGLE
ncbi:hypothetical protein COCOBI_16-0350 [Coccomyxa sp. Obi]|nr:hypothetical protein COCOBI_16-0350 [Coccomyxa sp. Obi]